jgi:hypothetical protein
MGKLRYGLTLELAGKITAVAPDGEERSKPADLDPNGQALLKYLLKDLSAGTIGGDRVRDLGRLLYQFLIGDKLEGHFETAWRVARDRKQTLSIRLRFDDSHRLGGLRTAALPWEFLYNERLGGFLATHSDLSLSRFVPLNLPTERTSAGPPLRILFVGSQPKGLGTVFTESAAETIQKEFEAEIRAGRVAVEILDRLDREALIRAIRESRPHVLHFMGHARFVEQVGGALALVDPQSGLPLWLPQSEADALFQTWQPHAAVVVACEGAAESLAWELASLAETMVRQNIQVVGMRYPLTNQKAMAFTREFYRRLAAGDPLDAAVQSARRRVSDADQTTTTRDFGGVTLFMRSPDGVILSTPDDRVKPPPPSAGAAPPLASRVVGREGDLDRVLARIVRLAGEPGRKVLVVRGWPGVGKTTFLAALAADPRTAAAFPDGVLWATAGESPDPLGALADWARRFDPGARFARLDEAMRSLRGSLSSRKMLLAVDDVWTEEAAAGFLVGGPGCVTVLTTRFPSVARALATGPHYIDPLPQLSEDDGVELLRLHAPTVVAQHPDEARVLVRDLEGLPLALRVAGRMLEAEAELGWGIADLLADLRQGAFLDEVAPDDRFDEQTGTIPTVKILLEKSTERLDPESRDRFALLGAFAPKPATFDLPALSEVWEDPNPKPTVRTLVGRGLLEPVPGTDRFQMHAVLVLHARSLLHDED